MMQVILLQDIAKLGRRYDTRSVAAGYARNYLILRGLALLATDKSLKEVERLKSLETKKRKEDEQILLKDLEALGDFEFTVKQKANDEGHLFGAVRPSDVVELFKLKKINLLEENILLKSPIKQIGSHEIPVSVGEREFKFKLKVEAD